ncbi:MAG TPA: PAS domain S-box protein [Hyphomonadaceae bacterium]|jgi:PAS domain S-box-containing protein|nr:PAS domain S-box protein [Hyphomonadaceae bacterium]
MSTSNNELAAQAFDTVDSGLIILDASGIVRGWNAWVARATRIPAADALGTTLAGAFKVEPPSRLTMSVIQALKAGASSLLTHALHPRMLPLVSQAGVPILHNISVLPLGPLGTGCLIQISDVTAITNKEAVLRERQNARYNAVVDSATDPILTIDAEGFVQWINKASEAVFGYASKQIVGRPVSAILGESENLSEAIATFKRAVASARPIETVARARNGLRLEIEFSASSWQGQGRNYITAILRDITERKAGERALLQLNKSLETAVAERTADRDRMWRLSSDMMVIAHLDGRITATNPAATVLLGWSEPRLVGGNIRELVVSEDLEKWNEAVYAIKADQIPRRFELRVKTADQKERWIEWGVAVADTFIQAVGRDVTAEKEAEAALHSAEEALRQSQKMEAIGQLTGGIAHDFNNLLAGVIGGLEIVKRRISTGRYEDLSRFMEASISSANRAASLTHRLLAFSRLQPLDPRPYDVNDIVKGMEELLRRSLGEQVRLKTHLGASLGLAATDANQLENAILNLAINARDAMPDGGEVMISTALADDEDLARLRAEGLSAGSYIKLAVADTGTGMSPDVLTKAFDPFFTTKPIGKGTGLGLSMIYGFAKQSQGHAEITSEIGKGTMVTLYLPQAQGAEPEARDAELEQAPRGAGETVLIVEDDPAVRMLIADVLHELGYAAIEVGDSRAALPVLQSDARLDLMVSDVGLPGIDGRKLAEIARQHRPNLKILFVTGYAQHARVRDEFLGKDMDMLTKPFALDALGHKIREMLS